MSKWEKLLARICALSNTFRKPGCQPITIPKHEPIKRTYVEMVKQVVESEDMKNEDAE